VRSDQYLMDTTQYEYHSVVQVNEDKTRPKITDYAVMSVEGEDVTQETFQGVKLFFVIYDVTKASASNMGDIVSLVRDLDGKVDMMALTASASTDFEAFRHEYQLAVPFYYADATVLKTMIR